MPQAPAAAADQKDVLDSLVKLAQTEAVATGNQVAILDEQIARFDRSRQLFQVRYDFWNNYVLRYHEERRLLNGQFIMFPINDQDLQDLAGAKGRLYIQGSLEPRRIPEFDQVGFSPTGQDSFGHETYQLDKENLYRNFLLGGFSGVNLPGLPFGEFYRPLEFKPGQQFFTIFRSDNQPIVGWPSGPNRVMYWDGTHPRKGVIIEYLEATGQNTPAITLRGLNYSMDFDAIGDGLNLDGSGPVFNNATRTTQIIGGNLQSRLHAYIAGYRHFVNGWRDVMGLQVAKLPEEIAAGEDEMDTAYQTSLQVAYDAQVAYTAGPSIDVSDAGLAPQTVHYGTRAGAVPNRLSYIDARLIQTVKAYDARFKYFGRLYNYADGSSPMLATFRKQKQDLLQRQAASNYRASQLAAETF